MNPNDKETNDPTLGTQPVVPAPQNDTVNTPSPVVAEPGVGDTESPVTDSPNSVESNADTIVASTTPTPAPSVDDSASNAGTIAPENSAATNPTEPNATDATAPLQGPVADPSAPVSPMGVPTVTPVSNSSAAPAAASGGKSKNLLIITMIVLGLLVLLAALGLVLA